MSAWIASARPSGISTAPDCCRPLWLRKSFDVDVAKRVLLIFLLKRSFQTELRTCWWCRHNMAHPIRRDDRQTPVSKYYCCYCHGLYRPLSADSAEMLNALHVAKALFKRKTLQRSVEMQTCVSWHIVPQSAVQRVLMSVLANQFHFRSNMLPAANGLGQLPIQVRGIVQVASLHPRLWRAH